MSEQYDPFVVNLNEQFYYFKATLFNGVQKAEIPMGIIETINIKETLFNWASEGSLLLKNDLEFFERGTVADNKSDKNVDSIFTFRSDSRNKLNIRFYPLADPGVLSISPSTAEKWELNYDFAITSIEDIAGTVGNKKFKQLNFVDERYQQFIETNTLWSTYFPAVCSLSAGVSPDPEYKCKVGVAIKSLLQFASGSSEVQNLDSPIFRQIPELKIGFDSGGTIQNPNLNVARFSDKWDDGPEYNKLFYSSPATYNVIDDLTYLLNHYISSDAHPSYGSLDYATNDLPGLLLLDRYKKQWSLVGIDTIFDTSTLGEGPGDGCIETLVTQAPAISNEKPGVNMTFITTDKEKNIHIPNTSVIYNYNIVPMSGIDDINITNRPVVHYDTSDSTWTIHTKQNSIEAVHNVIKDKITGKLYHGKKQTPFLSTNKSKLYGTNTIVEHAVSQTRAATLASRNDMIMKYIFLNQAISFNSRGLTIRTPGKFINIITNISTPTDFEKRFVGQWLLTEVNHMIENGNYITQCVAVKVSSYGDIKTTDSLNKLNAKI